MLYSISNHYLGFLIMTIVSATLSFSKIASAEVDPDTAYIPRAVLFSPSEVIGIKISPDSKFLAYVKGEPSGNMNLHICATNKCHQPNSLKQITHFTSPEIYRFFWTDDSKHIILLKDNNGSKSYQLYSININSGDLVNHTNNFKDITAKIFKVSRNKVAVGINDRNPNYHDVFVLDANNGTLTKIFENDRFSRFTFDDNLEIAFKEEVHEDGSIDLYKGEIIYMRFSPEDAFHSRILKIQNSILYYVDSRDSDTTRLKSVDLKSGMESNLAHNHKSDINDVVFVDGKPFMYSTTWLEKEWHSFGVGNLDFLQEKLGTAFEITSQSKNLWIIRSSDPKRIGASFYLYNRDNDELNPLFIAPTHPQLADMIPFEFEASDGLKLTAYLTLPNQHKTLEHVKEPIPLIVVPHGGPFQARDNLDYHPWHQWLASRGYAVLSINFRLSSGLGKVLVNAGNGEWGNKALFDLIDGVKWCIDHGITTKSQVGIMGASYGGYSTLAALAFTPKDFAVGISIVGPSSLVTVMEKLPKYWDWPSYPLSDTELFFTKGAFIKSMGGNPESPEGQRFLASRSPLNFSSKIQQPLLLIQGSHDPIVKEVESQQIFNELKSLKKKTCLLLFDDEGHAFKRYANIDVYLAYAEKWLHDVLRGRFEPMNPEYLKESSLSIQQ